MALPPLIQLKEHNRLYGTHSMRVHGGTCEVLSVDELQEIKDAISDYLISLKPKCDKCGCVHFWNERKATTE